MSFSPVPDFSFDSICALTPEFLRRQGITLLLLDLDNTLAPYGTENPPEETADWADTMKRAGIELFIVTNNRGSQRVESLSSAFGIGYIKGARKPFSDGVLRALEKLGRTKSETALAGDQIYTDVLAANCAGVLSIVVRPIKFTNPLFCLRYWAELPFRAMCRNKM